MPKIITAFVWNKTADVGVPPQREHIAGKNKKGKDIVTLCDDECLVIYQGKLNAHAILQTNSVGKDTLKSRHLNIGCLSEI